MRKWKNVKKMENGKIEESKEEKVFSESMSKERCKTGGRKYGRQTEGRMEVNYEREEESRKKSGI